MLSFTRRGFPTARAVVGSRWAADVRELVVARGEEAAAEFGQPLVSDDRCTVERTVRWADGRGS
jgi:hypothetical protein